MITVALPVYASPIAWLAMESLCRQKVNVKWELIIYEDEQYPNESKFYLQYKKRLKAAGGVSIIYTYSEKRIPLSYKWREMALMAHSDSIGIILQAGDNYSHPKKIQLGYDSIKTGYDWSYCPKTYF